MLSCGGEVGCGGGGFQTLFASTRRFNLLKSSPVDDDDIIICTSLSAAVSLSLSLSLSL